MGKIYLGYRTPEGCRVYSSANCGLTLHRLDPRLDLHGHSPAGFEWGYAGSGPAQLALALVADVTGDDSAAMDSYQDFEQNVVRHLTHDSWQLSEEEIWQSLYTIASAQLALPGEPEDQGPSTLIV